MTFLQKLHEFKVNSRLLTDIFHNFLLSFFSNETSSNNWRLLGVRRVVLHSRTSRLESLKALKSSLPARYPLARCPILQRSFTRRVVVYWRVEWRRQRSPGGLQKLTGTPSPTPINSISRYFAASRRAMDIALFLAFRPPCPFVVFLSSARFFFA